MMDLTFCWNDEHDKEPFEDLVRLADLLGIQVRCLFHGMRVVACPGDDPEIIKDDWSRRLRLSGQSALKHSKA